MGVRAYHAARAGIEWGAFQVLPGMAGAYATACLGGTATQAITPLPNTLAGFTVTVTCTSNTYNEAGATVTMFQLVSNARQGATPNYVERQISMTIAR